MRRILPLLAAVLLTSCYGNPSNSILTSEARVADKTKTGEMLHKLPPAAQKVVVSVYNFEDQTGQHKPDDNSAQYSRAVTQGGLAILNKALLDAGNGGWFTVIERGGLQNLLQERQLIRATRDQYRLPNGKKLPDLGPLLYAGLLFEGGIVSYESNVLTGGVGARYLGIGGSTEYRQDIVTVCLRAVSVQTGEVLIAANTSKTIYSAGISGGTYKYVAVDKLLEIESGFTVNEPPRFAVRQAIEMAVYSVIMEGASKGLWGFSDPARGNELLGQYLYKRDGTKPVVTTAIAPQAPAAAPIPAVQSQPIEPARAPDVIPAQPNTNATIEVPTGDLEKRNQAAPSQDPALTVQPNPTPYSEQYINNPKRDKLYCTSGGCFPFPPPTR